MKRMTSILHQKLMALMMRTRKENPALLFFFSDDNTIHQILNLASSPITPGPTPADSVKEMEAFLRDGILGITGGLATPLVLVKGNPFLRAYHHLRAPELFRFLNFLTQKEEWAHERVPATQFICWHITYNFNR